MRNAKIITWALVAISLQVVPLAWSQGGNPPASTKESRATLGKGMTAVEQPGRENVEQQILSLSDQFTQAYAKADTVYGEVPRR